jgi:acyl-CoA hydrolase
MRANDVEYFAPARFDDELEIHIRVSRIGRTSMTYEFAAFKVPDGTLLVTAHQTLVFIDLDKRRPIPIPDAYRAVRCRLTPTTSAAGPVASSRRGSDCVWAGIFFVEGTSSCSGPRRARPTGAHASPSSGADRGRGARGRTARSSRRARGRRRGIADLCLVGWDTGGELWQS